MGVIPITIKDYQRKSLGDKVNMQPRLNRVTIHEKKVGDNKLYLVTKSNNLIIYRGRSWLAQRAINKDIGNRSWKDRYISWLGLGTGGAVVGDPLTPTSPDLSDVWLDTQVDVGAGSNYVSVNCNGGVRQFRAFDANYPQFVADPDINNSTIDQTCTAVDPIDTNTYGCDKFLLVKIVTTIGVTEYNGGNDVGDYLDLSEAGLFVSPSNSLAYGFSQDDMSLFARVCFSSVRKDSSRSLIITWNIYF